MSDRFPAGPHLYVTGRAVEEHKPDFVETRFSVELTGFDLPAIKKEVDAITNVAWASAKRLGIAQDDFQVTGFSTRRKQNYTNGEMIDLGTEISRQFEVKLRSMDRKDEFNAWSQALFETGLNEIGHVGVDVDGREEKEAALRVTALRNAKAEADRLAGALDQVVTGVHTISDSPFGEGVNTGDGYCRKEGAGDEGAPALPDRVVLTAEVYVLFTMAKKQGSS